MGGNKEGNVWLGGIVSIPSNKIKIKPAKETRKKKNNAGYCVQILLLDSFIGYWPLVIVIVIVMIRILNISLFLPLVTFVYVEQSHFCDTLLILGYIILFSTGGNKTHITTVIDHF